MFGKNKQEWNKKITNKCQKKNQEKITSLKVDFSLTLSFVLKAGCVSICFSIIFKNSLYDIGSLWEIRNFFIIALVLVLYGSTQKNVLNSCELPYEKLHWMPTELGWDPFYA